MICFIFAFIVLFPTPVRSTQYDSTSKALACDSDVSKKADDVLYTTLITHDDFELLIAKPLSCCLPFFKKDQTKILKIKQLSFDINILIAQLEKNKIDRIHRLIVVPQEKTICFKTVKSKIECPICFEKEKTKETVELTQCGHHFHINCILPWISCHNSCPLCRTKTTLPDISTVLEFLTKVKVLICDLSHMSDLFLSSQSKELKIMFDIYKYFSCYHLFDNPSTTLLLPKHFKDNTLGMMRLNALIKSNTHTMMDVYGNPMDDLELIKVTFLDYIEHSQ